MDKIGKNPSSPNFNSGFALPYESINFFSHFQIRKTFDIPSGIIKKGIKVNNIP